MKKFNCLALLLLPFLFLLILYGFCTIILSWVMEEPFDFRLWLGTSMLFGVPIGIALAIYNLFTE